MQEISLFQSWGKMKNFKLCLSAILLLILSLPLFGCAEKSEAVKDEGVVDIEPGQKSIIQPPARTQNQGSTLEERSL